MDLTYGTKDQVTFETEESYYFTLGFLARAHSTELRWEHNEDQGAWGSEGRIHCAGDTENYPAPLKNAFTAGTGNILYRVNCNDYVKHIAEHHKFKMGARQDVDAIKRTVPAEHLASFERGLAS